MSWSRQLHTLMPSRLLNDYEYSTYILSKLKIKIIGKYLEKETDWARTYQKTIERLYGLESNREAEADL